jgi:hypothetical protein
MAHEYAIRPETSEADFALQPGLNARPIADELMIHHGYHGDLSDVSLHGSRLHLTISRPGVNYSVNYDRQTGHVRVQQRKLRFIGVLNRLHHLNGFDHSTAAMNAWGWVLAFTSIALIALGATGLYMWFRMYKERITGSILLGINLCVSIVLLWQLRT